MKPLRESLNVGSKGASKGKGWNARLKFRATMLPGLSK
jgi:hypothetical protein